MSGWYQNSTMTRRTDWRRTGVVIIVFPVSAGKFLRDTCNIYSAKLTTRRTGQICSDNMRLSRLKPLLPQVRAVWERASFYGTSPGKILATLHIVLFKPHPPEIGYPGTPPISTGEGGGLVIRPFSQGSKPHENTVALQAHSFGRDRWRGHECHCPGPPL